MLIEEAMLEKPFNAFAIYFYDYPEYVNRGTTLGTAVFAPGRDWTRANEVNPGDYYLMDYGWNMKEKNWSMQLTQEEVEVWNAWMNFDLEFNDINEMIAEEFNITPEEVEQIIKKQNDWMGDTY